jgi:adenylate kinase
MITIFLGAPGAGKGTQAAAVAGELGLAHVSSGDLFRQAVERDDSLGREVKSYLERGALVPDAVTTQMVLNKLDELKGRGVILDGFPRNLSQARSLDNALSEQGKRVSRVVYIKVESPELVKRLSSRWLCRACQAPHSRAPGAAGPVNCTKCGGDLYQRTDDTPETVKRRLEVYFKDTEPLINYYFSRGNLATVDGAGGVADITRRIVDALQVKP